MRTITTMLLSVALALTATLSEAPAQTRQTQARSQAGAHASNASNPSNPSNDHAGAPSSTGTGVSHSATVMQITAIALIALLLLGFLYFFIRAFNPRSHTGDASYG